MNSTVFSLVFLFYFLGAFVAGSFGLLFCFILYLHYIHKLHDHLPGPPRSCFILGHLPDLRQCRKAGGNFGEFILERRMQYGPIYVLFFIHEAAVIVGDPVYVREVFIGFQNHLYKNKFAYHKLGFVFGERGGGYGLVINTDEESWRKRRQIMNPAFHRKCLKNFMVDFNQVCDRFLKRMNHLAETREEISMLKEFGRVTLDVISQVSFNVNVGAIEHTDSHFPTAITSYLRAIQDNMNLQISPTLLAIFQFRLFQTATQREQINSTKFLRKFAFECITNRIRDIEAGKDIPNDLLTLLVNDKTLTMDDIMDEFITVFVAGQETTANSLAFTLYEILKNPDVETKILKEIEDVLGEKDHVAFEDFAKLKYLGQVMQESLRKHPVAGGPFRKLAKGITVGGYKIPKGTAIATSTYIFSHNPDIWRNPEIFDPERFNSPENISNFSMLYFPFSVGPRNCIGQTLAKFESKVVLARVLRRYQFKLLPGQTAKKEERLTVAPRDGVMCQVMGR